MLEKYWKLISSRVPTGMAHHAPKPNDLIVVAMSSGVDSSVAASLMRQKYQNVKGIFMINWSQLDSQRCLEQDIKDVHKVAEHLKIPLEEVSFEKEYWQDVFEPMIDDYSNGITPNPDINCNRFVKFGSLYEHLTKKYHDQKWWLVTGHYSRVFKGKEESELWRGYFKQKDQSYYLSQMNSKVLDNLLLPIGNLTKPEVRQIAEELEIPTAKKEDSMGLCFVNQTQKKFNDFLSQFLQDSPGNIITADGKVWGKHKGLWSYTIGQKLNGISLPQGDERYKGTWFISEKNFETNDITIVKGSNNPALFKQIVYVNNFIHLSSKPLDEFPIEELNIQYRSLQSPVKISKIEKVNGKLIFKLDETKRAISQGQSLAVYHNDRCLGSGVIEMVE